MAYCQSLTDTSPVTIPETIATWRISAPFPFSILNDGEWAAPGVTFSDKCLLTNITFFPLSVEATIKSHC